MTDVAAAAVILALAFVSVASSFGSNASASVLTQDVPQASRFLDTVLERIWKHPFDGLSSLDGKIILDRPDERAARFRARIDVERQAANLRRIRVTVAYHATRAQITQVVTYRSQH